jgi:hypothetical protein
MAKTNQTVFPISIDPRQWVFMHDAEHISAVFLEGTR